MDAESVYIAMMGEAAGRLMAADRFIAHHSSNKEVAYLESAALQVRKALETIAFSAISTNKAAYGDIRAKAEQNKDFRRDYHANRIFRDLQRVQKDFYPLALIPAVNLTPELQTGRTWHFDRKKEGYLTQDKFAKIYDRLAKYLHARNPWDQPASREELTEFLPNVIDETRSLIELHAAFIRTTEFTGVWIIEVPKDSIEPKIIVGKADGNFAVLDHGKA
ncbi:hypothetical protein [Burkholderia multivorans]|uniref:hypothetical protein n=1 Tax=Burkholderia multivorans TaxID=87883 RepID=UPI0019D00A1C|nr:hypothetical protein [Burkholderia multivorans]MBN6738883.1 hypothetical protein [Burkholderia multivorans]MBN7129402.1 hypothetical protein [Burkholderia multivorans]QSL25718.1 hypothetical protein G0D92_11180 [Burkholderia multivorans]